MLFQIVLKNLIIPISDWNAFSEGHQLCMLVEFDQKTWNNSSMHAHATIPCWYPACENFIWKMVCFWPKWKSHSSQRKRW